jgi:hypothetical protein
MKSESVRFEVPIAMTMKNTVSWNEMSCTLADVYQWFRGTCYHHLQGSKSSHMKTDVACSSKTFVSIYQTTWHHIWKGSIFQVRHCYQICAHILAVSLTDIQISSLSFESWYIAMVCTFPFDFHIILACSLKGLARLCWNLLVFWRIYERSFWSMQYMNLNFHSEYPSR